MRYAILFNQKTGDVKEVWIKKKKEIRDLKNKGYKEEYEYDDYYGNPCYFTFYCKRCKKYHLKIHSYRSNWFLNSKWFLEKSHDCLFDIQISHEKPFEGAKKIFEIAYGKISDEELAMFLRVFEGGVKYHVRRKFYRLLEEGDEDKIIEEVKRFVATKVLERL